MKILVALTFSVPEGTPPEALASVVTEILAKLDPPSLPHFEGEARVTVDPWASAVEQYLDSAE